MLSKQILWSTVYTLVSYSRGSGFKSQTTYLTGYPHWGVLTTLPQLFKTYRVWYLKLSPDRFLPHLLQSSIHHWHWGHYTTNRKVAGSIPDGVTGIVHWHNASGRTMAPGVDSASNRNEYQDYFLRGKGGRCVGLTLPLSGADCLEIWEPQHPGTLWASPGP